jgi:hypothetical protein
MLFINWARRVKCGKCNRSFEVSPAAFRNNCGLVFMTWSFLPFCLLCTVLVFVLPLPPGNPLAGQIALGVMGGLILACFFMGVGQIFGAFAESHRHQAGVKKKRRSEDLVRCATCGYANDLSESDECEHCGEELSRRRSSKPGRKGRR